MAAVTRRLVGLSLQSARRPPALGCPLLDAPISAGRRLLVGAAGIAAGTLAILAVIVALATHLIAV